MTTREYVGNGIIVHWDGDRCFHSERCMTGLPAVFDQDARPWVNLGDDPASSIAADPDWAVADTPPAHSA